MFVSILDSWRHGCRHSHVHFFVACILLGWEVSRTPGVISHSSFTWIPPSRIAEGSGVAPGSSVGPMVLQVFVLERHASSPRTRQKCMCLERCMKLWMYWWGIVQYPPTSLATPACNLSPFSSIVYFQIESLASCLRFYDEFFLFWEVNRVIFFWLNTKFKNILPLTRGLLNNHQA